MLPNFEQIGLKAVSLVIYGVVLYGVCSFFIKAVIPSFRKGTIKDISVNVVMWLALIVIALFILSSTIDSLTETLVWLSTLNYVWLFLTGIFVTGVSKLIMMVFALDDWKWWPLLTKKLGSSKK